MNPLDRDRPLPFTISSGMEARSPQALSDVLRQFDVAINPRYQPANGDTFCATFARDVALAMGCVLPTIFGAEGGIGTPIGGGFCELNANDLQDWLGSKINGSAYGWAEVAQDAAVASARSGHFAVATYKNPNGHGHIVVGQADGNYAQAGQHCGYGFTLEQCFGQLPVVWFVHL